MRRVTSFVAVVLVLVLCPMSATVVADPPPISFTRIIDTNTAIPGSTGNFNGLNPPSLDGGIVAFKGYGASNQKGIYLYKPATGLSVVANNYGYGPNGWFSNLDNWDTTPSISGDHVAFIGIDVLYRRGVYTNINGLSAVATEYMQLPDNDQNFSYLSEPSISGENVAFLDRQLTGNPSLYTCVNGVISRVYPNWFPSYSSCDSPSMSGQYVGFMATNNQGNWWPRTTIPGLEFPADGPPEGGTWHEFLLNMVLDGQNLAFRAKTGLNGEYMGVYARIGANLLKIADRDATVPGGSGLFGNFDTVSIDGERVAFISTAGVFVYASGSVTRIVRNGDVLDGKTVSMLEMDKEALSGNQLAFYASFTDGTKGIYVASIPEPATMGLLLAGMGILGRRRK